MNFLGRAENLKFANYHDDLQFLRLLDALMYCSIHNLLIGYLKHCIHPQKHAL